MQSQKAILAVATALAATPAFGQDWCELQKFEPDGRLPGDYFGGPVISMTSEWALITARNTDAGTFPGYAVMYERSGGRWIEHPRITSPRPEANIGFAVGAATNGDWAMIGAPREDIGTERLAGCVYVYRREGHEWKMDLDRTLTEPAPLERNGFGFGVAMSGDWATARNRFGLVYIFRFDGDRWVLHQQLTPDIGRMAEVKLDGDTLLVGERTDPAHASVYRLDPGTQQWLLEAELRAGFDEFFGANALHESRAVLTTDVGFTVFRRAGTAWSVEQDVFRPADARLFGWSVACHGDTIVVGDRGGPGGSVYWYQYDGSSWELQAKIKGSDPSTGYLGGGTVAVLDGIAIAGAPGSVDGRGLAYAFQLGATCACYADCDTSGGLDFFDFLCFQNMFAAGDPEADCDASGGLDFFDFLCFQNEFAGGCS
ncbi:MAG: hypothetical protein ACF8R7_04685 [Phycisphaerales bacterium JB039]